MDKNSLECDVVQKYRKFSEDLQKAGGGSGQGKNPLEMM